MHSCLQIPEMVREIIQWLYDDYRALTALAVTCQTFRDPASDLVWEQLDSLVPLIRCLPAHLLEEKVKPWTGAYYKKTSTTLYLKKSPVPADWERFDICAHRVRDLVHSESSLTPRGEKIYPPLDLSIFHCLRAHQKCLPNLISLAWIEGDVEIVPQFDLFVGPRLIRFVFDSSCHFPPGIFEPLSSLKDIKSLLLFHRPTTGSHQVLVDPVSLTDSVTQLRQISSEVSLAAETILHLSTLPSLTKFKIANDTTEIVHILTNAGSTGAFANIQDLTLFTAWPASCIGFLKLVRPAFLKRCNLRSNLIDSAGGFRLRSLYAALRDYCSHSQLEVIGVACADPMRWIASKTYTFYDLEPLLHFTNLREIAIQEFLTFDIDNANLAMMAAAWPRLEKFEVRPCADSTHHSKVGLDGLRELVSRCPALRYLEMVLHISSTDIRLWKERWGDCRNDKIEDLYLLESTFDCDAKELATFFYSVFPNLIHVAERPLGPPRASHPGDKFYRVNAQLRTYREEPKGQGLEGVVLGL